MSIKTFDMQVLIPKTHEVGKMQQVQLQEAQARQQEGAQQVQAETLKTSKQVNDPQKSEASYIQEKQEEEKRRRKGARKGKDDSGEKEEAAPESRKIIDAAGHLDVTV